MFTPAVFACRRSGGWWLGIVLVLGILIPVQGEIIWSDLGTTLAHETGPGSDILAGSVRRDDSATGTLYFKFSVNPISDAGTEPYFAAFELYENDTERLAVGNALNAWAYGAFNVSDAVKTNFNIFEAGNTNNPLSEYGVDLNSSKPTSGQIYELPRRGIQRTIVFKVQYVPGGKDLVTVWLDPELGPGATESGQLTGLTTTFTANASFNQIRLRHVGGGDGWIFSEMAIATSFNDFVMDEKTGTGLPIGRGQLPFTFQVWQREEGLPQNLVRALAQTKEGYLWIGGDAGVSRFDGVRFVSFGLPEGIQAGPVQTMLGDSAGALWIGSAGRGLGRWQNGHFNSFTTRDGLPSDSVNALAEDSQGRLWIGTEAGLATIKNGKLTTNTALAGKPVTALCSDPHGGIWIGARGAGLFSLHDGKLEALHESAFDNLLQDPHCVLIDHENRVWVGAGDDSLLCRESDHWRRFRFPRHLARHYISALAEDPDGTVWAGSVSEGVFQFKHGKLVAVNVSSGLSDNLVEALLVDREGKLWVGTHGGLNRLRPKILSVVGYNEGLGNGAVQGLAEVAPGLIWASRPSEGLFLWDGRYFRALSVPDLVPGDGRAGPLLVANDSTCWMGGARGLLHFKDFVHIDSEVADLALTNADITAIYLDAQGQLWIGSRQGELWEHYGAQWISRKAGPRGRAVTGMAVDQVGSVWVGTAGDGLYQVINKPGGGPVKQTGLLSDWIRALYYDAEGTLWVGTGGGGLARIKDGREFNFTTREGLPDNTISQILEDDSGNLWLGGDRGLACVNKNELNEVAAQKIPSAYPQVYGKADGMVSEECISGFSPIGLKTKSGLLWFPTQAGIVVANPRHQKRNAPAPAVVLEEAVVDGVPHVGEPLRLGPGTHRIEFRYTGLNFDAPERVQFRYRLEGLGSDWVEAGTSRSASFPYVPYGEYKFEVVAGNGEGGWEKTGASVPVTVQPYLWQTWWFRVPAALALLAAIAIVSRVMGKRKLQRKLDQLEQERALAQERERIARDLHDDLGSSLARISLLSGLLKADQNNPKQVETHAVKISQSADQTVRALEEIVWAVRPGSDSLQSLIEYIAHFANELFEGGDIRCRLDLPADLPAQPLPPDVRHNIFLVVKEALTNALNHAGAREVLVRAVATATTLEITVQDDGKGFDTTRQMRGNGLTNMRKRAEALGEKLTVESQSGRGTLVKITLHLTPASNGGRISEASVERRPTE